MLIKKWYLWLIVAGLAVGAASLREASNTQVLVDAREKMRTSCMKQGVQGSEGSEEGRKAFCFCIAEKMTAALGAKKTARLLSADAPTAEDQAVAAQAFAQCLEEE